MQLINQSSIRLILLIFPVSDHFVVPQGWLLTRELTVVLPSREMVAMINAAANHTAHSDSCLVNNRAILFARRLPHGSVLKTELLNWQSSATILPIANRNRFPDRSDIGIFKVARPCYLNLLSIPD